MHLDAVAPAVPDMPAQHRNRSAKPVRFAGPAPRTYARSPICCTRVADEVGLLPALDWYVSGFNERSGVKVTKENH